MVKVLVLYYSAYGHIETMAHAVADGAREAGAQVDVKRVPELVPEEVARRAHFKLEQSAPIARVEDLRQLRRHHRRHGHTLRADLVSDGELRRPGLTPADQERARRRPVSGTANRRDRQEAARLTEIVGPGRRHSC
jgi:hypothetical protein